MTDAWPLVVFEMTGGVCALTAGLGICVDWGGSEFENLEYAATPTAAKRTAINTSKSSGPGRCGRFPNVVPCESAA